MKARYSLKQTLQVIEAIDKVLDKRMKEAQLGEILLVLQTVAAEEIFGAMMHANEEELLEAGHLFCQMFIDSFERTVDAHFAMQEMPIDVAH